MEPSLVQWPVLVVTGYLIGSLPIGVIVARSTGGRDPRSVGSGRTGGTNALRAMGPGRGLAVGLLDITKGAVPVLLAVLVGADQLVQAVTGIAAVLGSCRSIFLRLHGGRGVAAAIGAMLIIQPIAVVLSAPVFFGVIWLSRYVSLGSLLGSAAAGLVMAVLVVLGFDPPVVLIYGIGAVALVWLAHADNIGRLLSGRERKLESLSRDAA